MNRDQQLPRFPFRLIDWFCPPSLWEGITGDLVERYYADLESLGERTARRRLFWNTIRFLQPGIILRNKFSTRLIDTIMLTSYLIVAFRNVMKNKVFSAINIAGLGTGLAACLLIFEFVSFELSYDSFNEKYDRTYRVTNDRSQHGKIIQHGTIMYPTIGPTMAKDYSEIEAYTRMMPVGPQTIRIDEKVFRGNQAINADEHFFTVFSYPILAGDRFTCLKDRFSIVLTEKLARKFFQVNDNDFTTLIGKPILIGLDNTPYKITAICANPPDNSTIQFDALISYSTLIYPEDQSADNSWQWSDMYHYLVLKPGVDYKQLESKFDAFSERYFKGDKVSGSFEKFYLQPLKDAHLYSDYEYDFTSTSNGKAVWVMLVVAFFILFIAWINYINLTTSKALDRAKEVGLRKVMGAFRSQLIKQFLFESILISAISFIVAFVLVGALQSPFNNVIAGQLSIVSMLKGIDSTTLIVFVLIMAGGVLLSGFYPAFVLSGYKPVTVLKGKFQRSSSGQFLRKFLVIFQFTTSAVLITGTFIISRQLKFMNEADLGINIKDTMIISSPELTAWDSTFIQRVENFKQELTKINGVASVSTSGRIPGDRLGRNFNIGLIGQASNARYTFSWLQADYNFFDTYGVQLVAGRKFLPTDHKINFRDINTVIINEKGVELLGIENAESAIGREIGWGDLKRRFTIIGVVRDFHQESLRNPKEAINFLPTYSTSASTSIRLNSQESQRIIAEVEKIYKEFFPGNAFEYFFLNERYNQQYKDDNRFEAITGIFTILAIIISVMGLIALSSYTATQRTKEIGIRKVLGASLANVVVLLSTDFMRLIVFATIAALPIAWFAGDRWLQEYAYRTTLSWWIFIVPAVLILGVAAFTMSFQVLRTARTNPAETLKYE